jgi:hypothetical protein
VASAATNLLLPRTLPGDASLSAEQQALAATAFRETWSQPWPGRVALSRPVYPSRDAATARRELATELRFQVEQANRIRARSGLPADLTEQEFVDSRAFHLGSVDEVLESLLADPALHVADELICQVGHLGPGVERTIRALELIATEVAPALGWQPRRD